MCGHKPGCNSSDIFHPSHNLASECVDLVIGMSRKNQLDTFHLCLFRRHSLNFKTVFCVTNNKTAP